MDKVMRLHSVSDTIEKGSVYLPSDTVWLASYVHELTTFPSGKYDDHTDSTSQALHCLKQQPHANGLIEYYRPEELAAPLRLPNDYTFTQDAEDEEIVPIHRVTGHTIRWAGHCWEEVVDTKPRERCPQCGETCLGMHGKRKHCNQCSHEWPMTTGGLRGLSDWADSGKGR